MINLNLNKSVTSSIGILLSLAITLQLFVPRFFDIKYIQTRTSFLLLFPFALLVFVSLLLGFYFAVQNLNFNSSNQQGMSNRIAPMLLQLVGDQKKILIALFLVGFFFCLYLATGLIMLENTLVPGHSRLDPFGADVKDWMNLQYFRDGYKPAHTNILLIVQPLESLFSLLPLPKLVSAVILNSLFSALNILLAFILFWKLTGNYLYTALLTLLLGLTASHIIFGSIPESYTLGSSSLVATYILLLTCLKDGKLRTGLWVLAGIFSFGVTITNFTQTLICFVATYFYLNQESSAKSKLFMTLKYIGAVVSCSIFLSVIQNHLYGSDYFFMPSSVVYEVKSFVTKINLLTHPFLVAKELFKHFFLVNFVAMQPSIINSYIYPDVRQLSFFGIDFSYSAIGFVAALLWGCIFVLGFRKNLSSVLIRENKDRAIFLTAVSLSILFNLVFHAFYGTVELFIYTCYVNFLVILLFVSNEILRSKFFRNGICIFIALMAINNLSVFLSFKDYSLLP